MATDPNDALDRARRLLEKPLPGDKPASAKPVARKNKFDETLETARAFNENVSWLRRTGRRFQAWGRKLGGMARATWRHSGPVRWTLGPILRFLWRTYLRFFRRVAYRTDPKTEERVPTKNGVFWAVILTIAMLVGVYFAARPVAITVQQAFMAAFAEKEAYTYFHGSETIEEGSLYSIKTTSQVPSTPESTMHMHVQQDLIYWIWYPEDLANAVPNEVAWGHIKYTGWRQKVLGWFPEVKDIQAIPLSELPESHPAKSGQYFISNEQIQQARRDGVTLPGTDLESVLQRSQ